MPAKHEMKKFGMNTHYLKAIAFTVTALATIGISVPTMAAGNEHDHHHHHAVSAPGVDVKRSVATYAMPKATLVRQDGSKVELSTELEGGKPVILAFIYTSCTAVCPVTSQILSQTQDMLGKDAAKVHIMSVSIDPEHDTPSRLADYSQKFGAKDGWLHYTGSLQESVSIQKAFQAFRGDKMNHIPLVFLKQTGSNNWVRLEGFPTAKQVISEYKNLPKASGG